MYHYKVGDVVQRIEQFRGVLGWPHGDQRMTITGITRNDHLLFEGEDSGGWMPERFNLVQTFSPIPRMEDHKAAYREQGSARANDPDTSKAAAKVKRTPLRDRVLAVLINELEPKCGFTGHELVEWLEPTAPLNSVTPRLAELRRADKIKDSGLRRDGQIVWVLA